MPIYEYKCDECGHIDEMTRPITERDKTPLCRKCHSITHRMMGNFQSITIGGWNQTQRSDFVKRQMDKL